jgi:hypothetical protein
LTPGERLRRYRQVLWPGPLSLALCKGGLKMNAFMIWYLSEPESQKISSLNGKLEKLVNVKIMLAAPYLFSYNALALGEFCHEGRQSLCFLESNANISQIKNFFNLAPRVLKLGL